MHANSARRSRPCLPSRRGTNREAQLRELGVRVVKIGTVFERMSYDKDVIPVQAGKPVEFVLENNDLMPHNFVILEPGSLEEIGLFSEAHAQQPGFAAQNYVPRSSKVLLSSVLLQPRDSQELSFVAPSRPGVYPYVCTYPGHWRRMYGALYVVGDLDAYLAESRKVRERVQDSRRKTHCLRIGDRAPNGRWPIWPLPSKKCRGTAGRNFGSGKQIFTVANCIACHRLQGVGNSFGPDLTKLDPKWKPADILNEVLNPSAHINEKFQMNVFELGSGKVVTGLVLEETPETIKIIENPAGQSGADDSPPRRRRRSAAIKDVHDAQRPAGQADARRDPRPRGLHRRGRQSGARFVPDESARAPHARGGK